MNGGRAGSGGHGGSSRYVKYIPIARRPANAGGIARTPNTLQQRTESTESEPQPLLQQQPAAIRRRPNPNALDDEHDDAEDIDFAAGDEEISSDEDEETDRSGADALAPVPASSPASTKDGTITDLDPEPRPDPLTKDTERRTSDKAIDADETDDKADAGHKEENSPDEEDKTEAEEEEKRGRGSRAHALVLNAATSAPGAYSPNPSDSDSDSTEERTTDLDRLPQPDPSDAHSEYFTDLMNHVHASLAKWRDYVHEKVQTEQTEGKKKKKFQRLLAETYAFHRERGGFAAIRDNFFEVARDAMLIEGQEAVEFPVQSADALHRYWDNIYVAKGGKEPPTRSPLLLPPGYIPTNIHGSGEVGQTCCRGQKCMALAKNNGGQNDAKPRFWRMKITHRSGEVEVYLKICNGCYLRALKLNPTVAYKTPGEFYAAMEGFAREHCLHVTRNRVGEGLHIYAHFRGQGYSSRCGAKLDDGIYRINVIPDDPT